MDFKLILHESPFFLHALGITAFLTLAAGLMGTILAAFLALMRLSSNKIVSRAATAYVEFMRGTPLLVQLFVIYFGGPQVGLNLSPITAAILGLGLNAAAYISEIFRGTILSIPKGQIEAARSLGMGHWLAMHRIIMPQALRHALPALGSSFAALVKDTSLVSVITVSELLLVARNRVSATYKPLEIYLLIGVMYFVLTTIITSAVRRWERRYKWSI